MQAFINLADLPCHLLLFLAGNYRYIIRTLEYVGRPLPSPPPDDASPSHTLAIMQDGARLSSSAC